MSKPHAIRMIASACSAFVFLLFAFPNYCDLCSYRDVEKPLHNAGPAATAHAEILPSCCDPAKAHPEAPARNDTPSDGKDVSHERISYCIGSTLSTVVVHLGLMEEIRRTVSSGPFRVQGTVFARLSAVLDHKDSRAPPA